MTTWATLYVDQVINGLFTKNAVSLFSLIPRLTETNRLISPSAWARSSRGGTPEWRACASAKRGESLCIE